MSLEESLTILVKIFLYIQDYKVGGIKVFFLEMTGGGGGGNRGGGPKDPGGEARGGGEKKRKGGKKFKREIF